jgi:hypothetical protein
MSTQDLPYLRWLHLTDLHIGKTSEPQRIAMQSLVRAIANTAGEKEFDLVLLTGDLAYSGHREEFETLEKTLIQPLRELPNFKNAHFLATPGNHDLDCDIGCPPAWSGIGSARQESFFNSDDRGKQIRGGRSASFAEYSAFIQRANVFSADPSSEPAAVMSLEIRGRVFALLPVVTSFFSDKDVKDQQKAPMPVQPVRALLQDVSGNYSFAIVFGHHPSSWFLPETDRRFNALIVEENALYLHGHEHLVTPKFSGRGLTSLGFGASYQASLDSAAKPYYRNSFAVCELDEMLHVQVVSWDAENGLWRPDQQLPVDFSEPSYRLDGGYSLKLPSTSLAASNASPLYTLASAFKAEVKVDRCIWMAEDDAKRWTDILVAMGLLTPAPETFVLPSQALPAGHVQFRVKDRQGHFLVHGISGNGDVLHYEQLQKINTELDTQGYDGCFVLSMGALSKEARTLADQLGARKALQVFERLAVVKAALRGFTSDGKMLLNRADLERVTPSLIVTSKGLALLFEDNKHEWFSVVDESGNQIVEGAELTLKLRHDMPQLARVRYEAALAFALQMTDVAPAPPSFDRAGYLARSHAYFDDVMYAPLAALGLRFKKTSLSEMYVAASADVGGTTKTSQNATRALAELLESLGLPKAQRDQLEAQMRARYGLDRAAEVGAASQLYQRYNNIVVLGDPGSGKTCFVKHEILSYSQSKTEDGGWYSSHLPVYVSLAEAAKPNVDGLDLLAICADQSTRRGLTLPRDILETELARGQVALFFDGLDEVGSIERRIELMAEIGKLVKVYAPRGNRFVIASRPAAVQPVDVPEIFTYVQLKGLTEEEMRILAGRVMTARLGDAMAAPLEQAEHELIERLLADTRNSPGIARIARNPLLLTLLVLTYANSGAVSAKRHVIYTQAIKTLVSVRGREVRKHQLSEADLRTRLGALAVAIFSRQIDEIPKRSDVVEVLSPAMARGDRIPPVTEVDDFIQEVAEATGILSIHTQNSGGSPDDLITFMHFSFLEYYTATGFITCGYEQVLTRLSKNPRWKDVTTLLFGVLSDYRDVTPDLRTLLEDDTAAGAITAYKLLLALDCASECDVPPEGAQDLLAEALTKSITSGAARYSAELRQDIASKLGYFLTGVGRRLEEAIVAGLESTDPVTAACFCHLVASLDSSLELSPNVQRSFAGALRIEAPVLRATALLAIEEHEDLRNSDAERIIGSALRGNLSEKHSALKVLCAIPEYHLANESRVRDLLEDANPLIGELAANSILINRLRQGTWNGNAPELDKALKEKVLAHLSQGDHENPLAVSGITLDYGAVEQMLASDDYVTRELAVRYISFIKNDAGYVHRTLSRTLRNTEHGRIRAACMDCFRAAAEALTLFSIADTDLVCSLVEANEKNVRIAALRLLGELPDDEQVVGSLKAILKNKQYAKDRKSEVTEAAKALAKHVNRNTKLRSEVLSVVVSYIPTPERGFGNEDHQELIRSLLYVCETIGGTDEKAAQKLLSLATSYRTPERIRRQALRAFGRLAEPNAATVQKLGGLLDKNEPRLREAIYPAVLAFIQRSRARVEYVRRIYHSLQTLRTSLERAWAKETALVVDSIDPAGPRDVRAAIQEIENLTAAYEEFSERATSGSTR